MGWRGERAQLASGQYAELALGRLGDRLREQGEARPGTRMSKRHRSGRFPPVVLAIGLVLGACGGAGAVPTPSGGPSATPADLHELADIMCADTTYQNCSHSVRSAAAFGSGALVALCEYGDRQGDVVLLDDPADAERACSRDGLITPSRVVTVFTIP